MVQSKPPIKHLIIQPNSTWYDSSTFPTLKQTNEGNQGSEKPSDTTISSLFERGQRILDDLSNDFNQSIQPNNNGGQKKGSSNFGGLSESDKSFINRIMTSGTSSDKLSALTLLVSSAPLHSRSHLTTLLNMSKKKNREEAGRTIRALVDWLSGSGNPDLGGLPPRKLKYFRDQPGLVAVAQIHGNKKGKSKSNIESESRIEGDEWLALWAFEDWLKKWYVEALKVIENLSHDPLPFTRNQSISHLFCLLRDKPEQEQNLLTLLVNKLGDHDKMVCSRTSHYLLQLLQTHPLMKGIVIRDISALILRPIAHQNKQKDTKSKKVTAPDPSLRHHDHARYYGTITLNQIALSKGDHEVSNRLIEVYFEMFKEILGTALTEEQEAAKSTDALKELNEEEIEAENLKEQEEMKKKSKGRNKSKSDHSLKKTNQEMTEEEIIAEKRSRLVAAILTGLNRAFPYGSLTEDAFNKHLNTLFRIIHTGTFSVSVQALILVQHLSISKPSTADRFYRVLYGTLFDYRLVIATSKHALYLNLLFKSLKADKNESRVLAFVKRIIQVLQHHQPSFICATLVLLGELLSLPNLSRTFEKLSGEQVNIPGKENESDTKNDYDGRKRDPAFANALAAPLWELVPLLSHYHPAVSLNASQLLNRQKITSSIDLNHHTLSSFLDKFSYRQPKKIVKSKGTSIMQPDLHSKLGDTVKKSNKINNSKNGSNPEKANLPLNSSSLLNRSEKDVPVDEIFFHKFFLDKAEKEEKAKSKRSKKNKKEMDEVKDFGGKGGSDDGSNSEKSESESGSSEDEEDRKSSGSDSDSDSADEKDKKDGSSDDEDEVWKAMKASMGKRLREEVEDVDDESWLEDMDSAEFNSIDDDDGDEDEGGKKLDGDDYDENSIDDDESDKDGEDFELEIDSDEDLNILNQLSNDDSDDYSEAEEEKVNKNGKKQLKRKKLELAKPEKDEAEERSGKKKAKESKSKKRRLDGKSLKNLSIFAKVEDFEDILSDEEE